jgi:hypothetical protein
LRLRRREGKDIGRVLSVLIPEEEERRGHPLDHVVFLIRVLKGCVREEKEEKSEDFILSSRNPLYTFTGTTIRHSHVGIQYVVCAAAIEDT